MFGQLVAAARVDAREMVLRCLIENARVRRAYLTGQL
jgi:hypothetical protein